MRTAHTWARGAIISIIVDIITLIWIWMRYCRNAVSWPICISPASTRRPPNHITPTEDAAITICTTGKKVSMRRPTRSEVVVSSLLARLKRVASHGSRTNARMTRRPAICSRSTRLSVSIRTCICRNSGSACSRIATMIVPITMTATAISHDRPMSSRRAMKMPPTIMIGACTIMNAVIITSVCTCWTSLVVRVIRLGAPKWLTSRVLNDSALWKIAARRSRPNPIAVRAPK